MKLYQTTAELKNPDGTFRSIVVWDGAAAAASKQRTALKKTNHTFVETNEIDVPTNKTDLLIWLNANAVECVK